MTQLTLGETAARAEADLESFFAHLDSCANKNAHVHGLHPYPAKFIPHIPRTLIREYAKDTESVVLDPMCGSGTTLVEASTAGLVSIGVDSNPVAALVSRAKTLTLTQQDDGKLVSLASRLELEALALAGDGDGSRLNVSANDLPSFHNRSKWFADEVSAELLFSRRLIETELTGGAKDVALCAFSAIIVPVSNQESETRWCAKPKDVKRGHTLSRLAQKIRDARRRLAEYGRFQPRQASVLEADARAMPIEEASVDLILTSPPYANSHDYYLYNKLRLFWLGFDVRPVQESEIGSRNRHSDLGAGIDDYVDAMTDVFREARRVARPSASATFVVGDAVIRGEFFPMNEVFDRIAEVTGWSPQRSYRFSHRRFNRTFQSGFGTRAHKHTHVLTYRAS